MEATISFAKHTQKKNPCLIYTQTTQFKDVEGFEPSQFFKNRKEDEICLVVIDKTEDLDFIKKVCNALEEKKQYFGFMKVGVVVGEVEKATELAKEYFSVFKTQIKNLEDVFEISPKLVLISLDYADQFTLKFLETEKQLFDVSGLSEIRFKNFFHIAINPKEKYPDYGTHIRLFANEYEKDKKFETIKGDKTCVKSFDRKRNYIDVQTNVTTTGYVLFDTEMIMHYLKRSDVGDANLLFVLLIQILNMARRGFDLLEFENFFKTGVFPTGEYEIFELEKFFDSLGVDVDFFEEYHESRMIKLDVSKEDKKRGNVATSFGPSRKFIKKENNN